MKRILLISTLFFVASFLSSCSTLRAEPVSYRANGVTLKGYLAYDTNRTGKRPGVLVIHEWWGHNEYVRTRARMLAELGYTALAVDMYGEGKQAAHPEEAGKFATEIMQNMDMAKKRFTAALALLKDQDTIDPKRIAVVGYCFGGGVALQMAREGIDIKGVVSFHGSLSTSRPAVPGIVRAKIFVAHGSDDKFVTPEQVDAFKEEMKSAGVSYRFVEYKGATHAFTNPEADTNAKKFNIPIAYNAVADKKSWNDMQAFFREIFGE